MDLSAPPFPLLQPGSIPLGTLREKRLALLSHSRLPAPPHNFPSIRSCRAISITIPPRLSPNSGTPHRQHQTTTRNHQHPSPIHPLLYFPQRSPLHLPPPPTTPPPLRSALRNLLLLHPLKTHHPQTPPPHPHPNHQPPPRHLHHNPLPTSPPQHPRLPSLPHHHHNHPPTNHRLPHPLPLHPLALPPHPPLPQSLGPNLRTPTPPPPLPPPHLPRRSRPLLPLPHPLAIAASWPRPQKH